MGDTKERIMQAALELFARRGYEAVSVSDIAGAVNLTKGALYRHFDSKRAILDGILAHMERQDADRAREHALPEGPAETDEAAYVRATVEDIVSFSRAMFRYWTEDPFAAPFRRLLTLEQYGSLEMARLYQQYLASGPLCYVTDLFRALGLSEPARRAVAFYGPMFLLFSVYDGAEDKAAVMALLDEYMEQAIQELKEETAC